MSWIQTCKRGRLDLVHPDPRDVDIQDVMWGLANKCRFTGQCDRFYSVAEHCVLGSRVIAPEHALAFLLHESDEVYLPDLATPLKAISFIGGETWWVVAKRHEVAVLSALGCPHVDVECPTVRAMDRAMLGREAGLIWEGGPRSDWGKYTNPTLPAFPLEFWTPKQAATEWLLAFERLAR